MRPGIIFVLYNTPDSDIARLTDEVSAISGQVKLYFIDHTGTKKGYAEGVNSGIKKALNDGCDIFIIANPDISLKTFQIGEKNHFLICIADLMRHFDVGGFAMLQQGKYYYGGEIDEFRLSGGLRTQKPSMKYSYADFVSGSLMIIKREVVEKIGYLLESYGMYYEDVDYCARASQAGFRVGLDASTYYLHYETSSLNPKKKYLLLSSRLKYMFRFGQVKNYLYELVRSPFTLYEERYAIKEFLFNGTFFRNFLSLSITSVINKLLFFGLFLVLTRTLTPADYGIYSLVWAHVGLFSPFLDLGTTSYGIVHGAADKKDKLNDLVVLRAIMGVFAVALIILFGWFWRYDGQVFGYITLVSAIMIANALSGSYLIVSSIFGRTYAATFLATVFNAVFISIIILTLFYYQSLQILFMTSGVLYLLYTGINGVFLRKLIPLKFTIKTQEWIKIFKKSYIYVFIGLFAGLSNKADIFVLSRLANPDSIGIYSAGYKFFDAFMFVAASYNISSTPIFSRLYSESIDSLRIRVLRDIKYMPLLGLVISIFVLLAAPYVIAFLKPEYAAAKPVLGIVIFSLPFILYSSVLMNGLYVMGKAKVVLYIFVMQAMTNLSLNILFVPKYSYFASAWVTVFSELLSAVLLSIILFGKYLPVKPKKADSA